MTRSEQRSGRRGGGKRGERGFLMAAVAASVAIVVIFSLLAFQAWVDVLRRDNEAEMIFRAQDLVRAIQRYRRDHGGVGPAKLEDLMKPGPKAQYYLRQLWKDPLVKDGKWGLIYVGPGGQIIDPNAPPAPTGLEGAAGPLGGVGNSGSGSSVFDDKGAEEGRPEAGAQGGVGQPPGQQLPGQQPPGQRPEVRPLMSGDAGADENAGGKQLSGLPIAGVRTLCEDDPFRVHNGLTEYREWLFTYLDLEAPQLPTRGRSPGEQPRGLQPARGLGKPGGPQRRPPADR